MLERRVALRLTLAVERVGPLCAVVLAGVRIESGEEAVGEAVAVADDPGRVRVFADVLFLNAIMLDRIVDHAADEGDVGARAELREDVGDRAGAVRSEEHTSELQSHSFISY